MDGWIVELGSDKVSDKVCDKVGEEEAAWGGSGANAGSGIAAALESRGPGAWGSPAPMHASAGFCEDCWFGEAEDCGMGANLRLGNR